MQQRPVGITILAIAAAVLGVLAILAAGAWWNASEGLSWLPRIHGGERLIALSILLPVGVAELAFAYGAWTLRPWAWTFGVVLEVIVIVLTMLQLGRLEFVRLGVSIGIAAVTLWYLTTPRVRAAFGRP